MSKLYNLSSGATPQIIRYFPIAFLFLVLPLAFFPWTAYPGTLRLVLSIFGISLQFFLFTLFLLKKEKLYYSPIFYLLLIHFLWLLIVSSFSPFFFISLSSTLLVSLFFLLFFLSYQRIKFSSLLPYFLFPLPLVILVCFLQKLGLIHWGGRDFSATIGQKNLFALYLVISTPFLLTNIKLAKESYKKWLWGILLLSLLVALIISRSRSGWLSFIVVNALFFLPQVKRERRKLVLITFLLIMAMLLTGVLLNFYHRYTSFERPARLTIPFRYLVWKGGWKMFLARPLTGWGKDTFPFVFPRFRSPQLEVYVPSDTMLAPRTHNEYLQVLAEEGIIGEIIFLLFWFFVLREGWRKRDDIQKLSIFSALAGMLFHGLFSVSLRYPIFLFYLYYFAGSLMDTKPRELSSPHRKLLLCGGAITLLASLSVSTVIFSSDYLLKQGETNMRRGDIRKGRESMEKALRISPFSPRVLYKLGKARFLTGDFTGALAIYQRLENIAGDYVEVHANMARCYFMIGEFSRAYEELTIAEKLHPSLNKYKIMKQEILKRWKGKRWEDSRH
ncbi:MAG: tetratricopeptide repeat protein [Caldiserica bacterium]|nr:tetratricopeptide repeat protein [Caldisericota bacterium]